MTEDCNLTEASAQRLRVPCMVPGEGDIQSAIEAKVHAPQTTAVCSYVCRSSKSEKAPNSFIFHSLIFMYHVLRLHIYTRAGLVAKKDGWIQIAVATRPHVSEPRGKERRRTPRKGVSTSREASVPETLRSSLLQPRRRARRELGVVRIFFVEPVVH